jgi:hypothetical protein
MILPNLLPSVLKWHSTPTADILLRHAPAQGTRAETFAIGRDLARQASQLTEIPLFDPSARGAHPRATLALIPTKLPQATATDVLTSFFGPQDPAEVRSLLARLNPATGHAGGRPFKTDTYSAYPHEFDLPTAKGVLRGIDRGQANFADVTSSPGLHRFADGSPASDYHFARSLVIRQRVFFAQQKSSYRSLAARRRNVNA